MSDYPTRTDVSTSKPPMKKISICLMALILSGCATAPTVNPQDVTRISRTVTSLVLRFCFDDQDRKEASDTLYGIVVGIRSLTGVAQPASDIIETTIMGFAGNDEKWRVAASFISLFGNNLDAVASGVETAAETVRDH